jgi:hypothetical protein
VRAGMGLYVCMYESEKAEMIGWNRIGLDAR